MTHIIAKMQERIATREREQAERLRSVKPLEVRGIVNGHMSGGGRIPTDTDGSFALYLSNWRVGDGPISSEPLRLAKRMSEEEMGATQALINEHAILRVRARIDGTTGHGIFEEILGPANDPPLDARAAALQIPVVHNDPVATNDSGFEDAIIAG